jgi:hypothetical protein
MAMDSFWRHLATSNRTDDLTSSLARRVVRGPVDRQLLQGTDATRTIFSTGTRATSSCVRTGNLP